MENLEDVRRLRKLGDLRRYIERQCDCNNVILRSIADGYRYKLYQLTKEHELTSDEIDSLRQEVLGAISALKKRERDAAENYKVGQELWLSYGPATVSKVYTNHGITYVAVQYLHGDIRGTSMRGRVIQRREKDKNADPELYDRDREYCLLIAKKVKELRDDPDSLAKLFRQHIKWSDYKEYVAEAKKQLEPLGVTDNAIHRKAAYVFKEVADEDPLKSDTIAKIKTALIDARKRHLNEGVSFEDILSDVAFDLRLIMVRNVYRQVLPAFYRKEKRAA